MEDSSWSGWTTPPGPPARELGYPEGRKLTGTAPTGGVGELLTITYASRGSASERFRPLSRHGSPGRLEQLERAPQVPLDRVPGRGASTSGS